MQATDAQARKQGGSKEEARCRSKVPDTLLLGNAISCTHVGIHFLKGAGNAIIDGNRFDNVDQQVLHDRKQGKQHA